MRVAPGRATSESFQITWNGTAFELHGSRSGLHKNLALPGTPYLSDGGELSFTVALSGVVPEIGTSLSFATESGVETLDTGGFVTDLIVSADQQSVYATVLAEGGGGFLVRYDAQNFTEEERVSLGETAVPESLDWGVNDGRLWIADSAPRPDGTGRILGVDTSSGVDWVASIVEVPVPEPAIDVAEGRDPEARRLFVGAAFSDAVWMLDGESLQVLDTNPITPELDPAHVRTLVAGLGASLGLIETNDLDEDGTRLQAYGVLATTFGGELYWLDASSGCQVYGSPAGAAIDTGSDSISSLFVDVGYESDPELVWNASSERFVSTHSCGGVARSELWTVTFDEQLQSYEVEGSRSGLQENRAFEGTRYLSDSGAISFLVLPGVRPTTAGDRWLLPIQDGVTPIPLGEFPGDPLVYTELYDDRSGAWFHVKERQIALVPHLANDVVLWIDIQGQGDGGMRTYR